MLARAEDELEGGMQEGFAGAGEAGAFEGFAGVNNHMGSRFTTFKPGMETVLRQLKGRGLMFLDSRTSAQSVGDQLAQVAMGRGDDPQIGADRRAAADRHELARIA